MATNPGNSPEAWVQASLAHGSVGNYAEVLVACNHALQLNPTYALALNPNDPANWRAHVRIYRFMGNPTEAEAAERRARELGG